MIGLAYGGHIGEANYLVLQRRVEVSYARLLKPRLLPHDEPQMPERELLYSHAPTREKSGTRAGLQCIDFL